MCSRQFSWSSIVRNTKNFLVAKVHWWMTVSYLFIVIIFIHRRHTNSVLWAVTRGRYCVGSISGRPWSWCSSPGNTASTLNMHFYWVWMSDGQIPKQILMPNHKSLALERFKSLTQISNQIANPFFKSRIFVTQTTSHLEFSLRLNVM